MFSLRSVIFACFFVTVSAAVSAGVTSGADLPAGKLPKLDGRVDLEEWKGALRMEMAGGAAYLRTAGRVLCLAIEMPRPYRGERIDLRLSDPTGTSVTLHRITPAGFLPRAPYSPVPAVLIRRSAWAEHNTAAYGAPYAARLRCRLLGANSKSWSLEFCVAVETLDVPLDKPIAIHLSLAPPRRGSEPPFDVPPRRWAILRPKWNSKAPLFTTPKEDRVNEWSLDLFREVNDMVLKRPTAGPLLAPALDKTFDPARVEALLAGCAAELALAPNRMHALWFRCHLLRRSNRMAEAEAAWRDLLRRLPDALALPPVAQERNLLLVADRRFDDFEKENRGMDARVLDRIISLRTAWDREQAWRKLESARRRPRFEIETTRGKVVVELYEYREPGDDKRIPDWLAEGAFTDKKPEWVTGAMGFAFAGMPKGARCGKADARRLAWRGTLALLPDRTLVLATGHVHIYRDSCALGRVVEGMEHVDALGAKDRILSARLVLPGAGD